MTLAAATATPQALSGLLAGLTASTVPEVMVSGVTLDSRSVQPGDLFLACPGLRGHGLDYAAQAQAAGAAAIVWDAPDAPALTVPNVRVHELAAECGQIAARFWQQPAQAMFVTGITGTDGKTSCAHLLAQALARVGERCGYMGTLGYGFVGDSGEASHTTPDAVSMQAWLARLRANDATATALEASSHALAQHRVDGVAFDVAVLTNIGRDHLDYHGDMAHYAAAKRRLFDRPGLRCAVLNADDDYGRQWLQSLPAGVRPLAFAEGAGAASQYAPEYVEIIACEQRPRGLALTLASHAGELRFDSALIGRFNAANLAAVLAVLLAHDIDLASAGRALQQLQTVPGRMQQVSNHADQPLVVVDFAHTPNALDQALRAVAAHVPGRIHCVFGCGGDRDRGKRPLMGAIAARYADALWLTDDNPRTEAPAAIVADIVAGIAPETAYVIEHDRRLAISQAIAAALPGDVVLIAGKGHETTQTLGDQVRPFDDRVIARQVLEAA